MHPYYDDILALTDKEPIWYMPDGVPRFCEFSHHMISIYADYSVLYKIACQSCGKQFLVGADYSKSDLLLMRVDPARIDKSDIFPIDENKEIWCGLDRGLYAPHMTDENGKNIYRYLTIEEVVRGFHYGDPPAHGGCVGETMNSVPLVTVQVWDINHGQISEPEPNGKYNIIKKPGSPARLPELEGLILLPDWAKDDDSNQN